MSYLQGIYPVLQKESIARNTFKYILCCPEVAALSKAGQFVHIKAEGFSLRRPLSICEIDREKGTLTIVFEIRGKGTAKLAEINQGGTMDLLGPLGNGFALLAPDKKAVVIGGGIGVPPMLETARHYGKNAAALLGFRSADVCILERDFKKYGIETHIATDDGTKGQKGLVTDILKDLLQKEKPDILYACGPKPMLKTVAELAKQYPVRCQVSLEERMACGVGACLGCACKIIGADGQEHHKHVCKDGPVFEAEEVAF